MLTSRCVMHCVAIACMLALVCAAPLTRTADLEQQFRAALEATLSHEQSVQQSAAAAVEWSCETLVFKWMASGVSWSQLNCTSSDIPFWGAQGPAIVNVVTADLSVPGVRLRPGRAQASNATQGYPLQPLNEMAASQDGWNIVAGINGGYFWELNSDSFVDSVCQGKTRADAAAAPSADPTARNLGAGDGTLVVNGTLQSSNCDCHGYNRPALLNIPDPVSGLAPSFELLSQGAANPAVLDSLGAGPMLLQTNASGTFLAIPADDENLGNILEHAANTAVGLRNASSEVLMVTFDGYDGCSPFDNSCGFNAFVLASFLRDYLGAQSAMGCDQGGSTTMFVAGQGVEGIVSKAGGTVRPVFDGLFVTVEGEAVTIAEE